MRGKGRFKNDNFIGKGQTYYLDGSIMRDYVYYENGAWELKKAYNKKGELTFKKGIGEAILLDSKERLLYKEQYFNIDSCYKEFYNKGIIYEKGISHKNKFNDYIWKCLEVYDELGNNFLDSAGSGVTQYVNNSYIIAKGEYKNHFKTGRWYYYDICTGDLLYAEDFEWKKSSVIVEFLEVSDEIRNLNLKE